MADPSPKYTKYVKGYTSYLNSKDVEKRRKGARMVGELGAAETIEKLIDMMDTDPDAQVRKNAAYSLGMFAAFRDAVESDDTDLQDDAIDNLTRVMETGKIGEIATSTGGAPGWLVAVLGVLLVGLIAGNVVIFLGSPGGSGDGGADDPAVAEGNTPEAAGVGLPSADDQDVETLITQGRDIITALNGNANTLRAQLGPIAEGNVPEQNLCLQNFNAVIPAPAISASDAEQYPEVLTVYEDINTVREEFTALYRSIESVCYDGVAPDTIDAEAELAAIDAYEVNAQIWSDALAEARVLPEEVVQPTAVPDEPTVAVQENATEEPPPAPTEAPQAREHISAIINILDEAGNDNPGSRSAYTLLRQYLDEAVATGATDGCRTSDIPVPENYNLAIRAGAQYDDLIAIAPGLEPAIEQTNTGLDLLRAEITAFQTACEGGDSSVAGYAGSGLASLDQIRVIFDNAEEQINLLLTNQE